MEAGRGRRSGTPGWRQVGAGSPETPGAALDLYGLEQRSEVALAEAAAAASLLHAAAPAGSLHLALTPDALDDLDEHSGPVAQRLAEDLQQDALHHPDNEQPLARMTRAAQVWRHPVGIR